MVTIYHIFYMLLYYILYNTCYLPYGYSIWYPLPSILHILYQILFIFYTIYYILYTIYDIPYIIFSKPYTIYHIRAPCSLGSLGLDRYTRRAKGFGGLGQEASGAEHTEGPSGLSGKVPGSLKGLI